MTRRIGIIGAGGTIAMQAAHAFDWVDYGDSGIVRPVDQVIAGVDFGLPEIEVVPIPFRMLPGTGIGNGDWLELAGRIAAISAEGGFDGLVVTHGTATLEETAFFLFFILLELAVLVLILFFPAMTGWLPSLI